LGGIVFDMELKNKVVVITGASRGLGKALAHAFAGAGSKLMVAARSEKDLQEFANNLNALVVATDVTNEAAVMSLADATVQKYGRIDIWINNAGVRTPHAPIEEMDMKRVHDIIEVNLFGTMYGSKAALIQMKKQGSGTIINILSTSALEGRKNSSGYVASKYAATGFTKSLRLEVEDTNIKVIAIYPGGMQTSFFDEQKPNDYDKYMLPSFVVEKIIQNLQHDNPEEELIIKRPQTQ